MKQRQLSDQEIADVLWPQTIDRPGTYPAVVESVEAAVSMHGFGYKRVKFRTLDGRVAFVAAIFHRPSSLTKLLQRLCTQPDLSDLVGTAVNLTVIDDRRLDRTYYPIHVIQKR